MKTSFCSIGLSFLLMVLIAQDPVIAHAMIDHADPRVGSTLGKAPGEVRIWFTQDIEPAFSAIKVFDADGKPVQVKSCHVDVKDKTLLIATVPTLAAGTYKVVWHVVSVDTHRTQGDFKFVIKLKPKE